MPLKKHPKRIMHPAIQDSALVADDLSSLLDGDAEDWLESRDIGNTDNRQ